MTRRRATLISAVAVFGMLSTALASDAKEPDITATCRKGATIENGRPSYIADVRMQIRGAEAGKVYAVGEVTVERALVDGREVAARKARFPIVGGFARTDRWGSAVKHPKDGVGIRLSFPGIPKDAEQMDKINGGVEVLSGGVATEVTIKDLSNRKPGPIESPVLKAAGLRVSFDRKVTRLDERAYVGVKLPLSDDPQRRGQVSPSFAGLQLIEPSGLLHRNGPQCSANMETYECGYWIEKADLEKASLKVLVRDGGEVKTIPFEIHNVSIK